MPNDATPARIRDLPIIQPRVDQIDDHAFLAAQWARGPLARDSIGMVYSFPYGHWAVLFDDRYTRQIETEGIRLRGITEGPIFDFFANSLLTSNAERHRARRTPLARTFAFPMMKALRPAVAATAQALIEPRAASTHVDLLEEIAGPMPALIIARVLGVPETDVPRFTRLVYSAIRALAVRSDDVIREAEADMGMLTEYVSELLATRRANPLGDFLSEFLASVEEGALSENEIRITIVTLILGGSDTTRASMAMTLARLLQHPRQWALLKSDPDRWKGPAVQEGLRFDPVVGSLGRIAVTEFELAGTRIVPGTIFSPVVLTALRDPAVYADPERFDITREDHPRYSPGFGSGAHRCLGEALARIELEEALAAFARYWPDAQLSGPEPRMRGVSGTRGISGMSVSPAG
ncbi:cytochrome P450 [Sulfitobacter sabulilitoris]|uniref:Cytochrome P450 n=1 Tax=Sulfitobacter sabulilitoris TaxID=2562655 RepID=A0A5S3PL74_9RHOB|nr:cytochrome P450 [Sulfitobacter sabulilitoris]TMM55184.1 cytochrome P450 [Sulfitobacter sabulilitoris]